VARGAAVRAAGAWVPDIITGFLILEETSRGEEKEPERWVGDVPFALMERLQAEKLELKMTESLAAL
jgi:hypothetical protein